MLPSAYTPDHLKITELFKKGTEPTVVSPRFEKLENITNLKSSASGSSVTLMWDPIKTPDLGNPDYLQKYYSQVFKNPGFISQEVGNHLAVTGSLGYDIYEKDEDGKLELIGSTTSSTYTFNAKNRGEHTYVVKSAYTSFKSNQSAGVSTKVRTSHGSDEYLEDATISVENDTFNAGTYINVQDLGKITVRINNVNVSNDVVVTFYSVPNNTKGTRSVKFKILYKGEYYTASTTLTFK